MSKTDEYEHMTMSEAVAWARAAEAGDYLVEYEDTNMTAEEDPGSRCGFGDDELAEIERILRERDLSLEVDDVGLVAQEK